MYQTTSNWAFYWVQIMAHHKKSFLIFLFLAFAVSLVGLWQIDSFGFLYSIDSPYPSSPTHGMSQEVPLWWQMPIFIWSLSLALISAFFGWQAESIKTGLLQGGFLLLTTLLTMALSGWFEVAISSFELLGLVIVLTVITANSVHLFSSLHREMARGLFQFDAMAEAIKLNHTPIFLSNLTTAFGVLAAAWMEPAWMNLAWVVALGVLVSYLLSMSLIPLVLLSWLLEFRVGNSRDRHGFYVWINGLETLAHRRYFKPVFLGLSLLVITSVVAMVACDGHLAEPFIISRFDLVSVLGAFFVLFALWWRKVYWAFLSVALLSLTVIAGFVLLSWIYPPWQEDMTAAEKGFLLLMIAPMGIIVDDLIHFFARYRRSQYTVFANGRDAVRFAMLSVGRPIFITSMTLILAMGVIFFLAGGFMELTALMILISIIFMTFFVLLWLPLVLLLKP